MERDDDQPMSFGDMSDEVEREIARLKAEEERQKRLNQNADEAEG